MNRKSLLEALALNCKKLGTIIWALTFILHHKHYKLMCQLPSNALYCINHTIKSKKQSLQFIVCYSTMSLKVWQNNFNTNIERRDLSNYSTPCAVWDSSFPLQISQHVGHELIRTRNIVIGCLTSPSPNVRYY